MITTICCIYCCKQLVYSLTRSLVNFSKSLCLFIKQLVHSSTCSLVYLLWLVNLIDSPHV